MTETDALPPCPACAEEYAYEDGALLVCPMCGHEWSPAADEPELTDGFNLVIDALKLNGIETIYNVPGIPITDLGRLAQAEGLRVVSFRHEQNTNGNERAGVLAAALDKATEKLLDEGKSPSRKVGEIDDRGSHFWLSLYWAEALAAQTDDAELASVFGPIAEDLRNNAETIDKELLDAQGNAADLGGYYWPDEDKTSAVMRPSATFNKIIDALEK